MDCRKISPDCAKIPEGKLNRGDFQRELLRIEACIVIVFTLNPLQSLIPCHRSNFNGSTNSLMIDMSKLTVMHKVLILVLVPSVFVMVFALTMTWLYIESESQRATIERSKKVEECNFQVAAELIQAAQYLVLLNVRKTKHAEDDFYKALSEVPVTVIRLEELTRNDPTEAQLAKEIHPLALSVVEALVSST